MSAAAQGETRYRALTEEERKGLEDALAHASRLVPVARPLRIGEIQALFEEMLHTRIPGPRAVEALGVAFGHTCLEMGGVEWARIIDAAGEESVIALIGKQAHFSPITMFESRLRMGIPFDLRQLRDDTLQHLRSMAPTAKAR